MKRSRHDRPPQISLPQLLLNANNRSSLEPNKPQRNNAGFLVGHRKAEIACVQFQPWCEIGAICQPPIILMLYMVGHGWTWLDM